MDRRIICGVTVDDTETHNEAAHWKGMYERQCNEDIKLYKEIKSLTKRIKELEDKKEIEKTIKCDKCNGDMKYIDQFKVYVCLTCGNGK